VGSVPDEGQGCYNLEVTPEERYRAHEWLVLKYARRLYLQLRIELGDAVGWGSLGLWKAAHQSHPTWEAFARMKVEGAIRDGARAWHSRYYGPESVRPTHVPLDSLLPWQEPHTEPVEPDPWLQDTLREALICLDAREADIVASHLGGEPLGDIAKRMGISLPRASQLKSRAIRKLRAHLGS
jgi:RNA polymerase sigma factor (sigma-70 family)